VFGTCDITFKLETVYLPSRRAPVFTICNLVSSYLPLQGDQEPHLTDPAQQSKLSSSSLESFKKQANLQESRLLQATLLDKETGITVLRKRHEQRTEYCRMQDSLCICSEVHCLMEKLEFPNDPEEWGIFIDESKLSLKAVLLQNAKVKPSKSVVHSVAKNEKYAALIKCNQLQGTLSANVWGY
jgi:hypothetical protein